jgi:hypothetical protein
MDIIMGNNGETKQVVIMDKIMGILYIKTDYDSGENNGQIIEKKQVIRWRK